MKGGKCLKFISTANGEITAEKREKEIWSLFLSKKGIRKRGRVCGAPKISNFGGDKTVCWNFVLCVLFLLEQKLPRNSISGTWFVLLVVSNRIPGWEYACFFHPDDLFGRILFYVLYMRYASICTDIKRLDFRSVWWVPSNSALLPFFFLSPFSPKHLE